MCSGALEGAWPSGSPEQEQAEGGTCDGISLGSSDIRGRILWVKEAPEGIRKVKGTLHETLPKTEEPVEAKVFGV